MKGKIGPLNFSKNENGCVGLKSGNLAIESLLIS